MQCIKCNTLTSTNTIAKINTNNNNKETQNMRFQVANASPLSKGKTYSRWKKSYKKNILCLFYVFFKGLETKVERNLSRFMQKE